MMDVIVSPVRCGASASRPMITRPSIPWKGTALVTHRTLPTAAVPDPAWRERKAATAGTRRAASAITAKKREIEGATEEMSAIASRDMDFAPARREVRAAFAAAQERLDHFLFKVAPTGIRMEERYEKNSKGLEIFWKSWLPRLETPVKGTLFFCHGYGDTCTFFFEGIAKRIAAAGYTVYAMDYPGFGLSEGLHGYIPNFDEMVDHVIEQYAVIRAMNDIRGLPHFLLGQSMGGAVALKVHLKQPKEWDGIILVAPMCKIAEDVTPSRPVLMSLTILSSLLPQAKLFPTKDLAELAFRDPEKRKMADYNVISYSDKMRLRTAIELLKATRDVESQVAKVAEWAVLPWFRHVIKGTWGTRLRDQVSSPLLVLHGAADKVTDPLVSKFLYDTACSQDKSLKLYEEGYHSILEGEPDDRISAVISDIISWLNSHCALV